MTLYTSVSVDLAALPRPIHGRYFIKLYYTVEVKRWPRCDPMSHLFSPLGSTVLKEGENGESKPYRKHKWPMRCSDHIELLTSNYSARLEVRPLESVKHGRPHFLSESSMAEIRNNI